MPEKKSKMGRPKLPKGEARNIVIQTRVQKSEYDAYIKAAKAQSAELSTWIREALNQTINNQGEK